MLNPIKLNYKGYQALVAYDQNEQVYHGKLVGIRDNVCFVAYEKERIKEEFISAVEDYLNDQSFLD